MQSQRTNPYAQQDVSSDSFDSVTKESTTGLNAPAMDSMSAFYSEVRVPVSPTGPAVLTPIPVSPLDLFYPRRPANIQRQCLPHLRPPLTVTR